MYLTRSDRNYLAPAHLVTLAMNGWANPEPAWWLNLQSHPEATALLADGPREARGQAAIGAERERLWKRWGEFGEDYEAYASLRSSETAVVVLAPLDAGGRPASA